MKSILKRISMFTLIVVIMIAMLGGLTFLRTVKYELGDNRKNFKAESFTADFEKHFPRGKFFNKLLYVTTGIVNSDQVFKGSNNWLFYCAENDGDSLADYMGTNDFSVDEMNEIKNKIESISNTLEEKGIGFALLIPPNKENVYCRYMPDRYAHASETRTDRLIDYLNKSSVNVINPKAELIEYANRYNTYFSLDTHWNELGGYLGTAAVVESFGLETPSLDDTSIIQCDRSLMDLANVTRLNDVIKKDTDYTTVYTLYDYEDLRMVADNKLVHIHNEKGIYDKTLFIIGDSFRTAMEPNRTYFFTDVFIIHRDDYVNGMVEDIDPDYVVLEYVERYSDRIKDLGIVIN